MKHVTMTTDEAIADARASALQARSDGLSNKEANARRGDWYRGHRCKPMAKLVTGYWWEVFKGEK